MGEFNNTSAMAELQFKKRLSEYTQPLDERSQAALFAQCVELQVLKAPASAVFPSFDEMVVNGRDGHYSVSGFVDSQNSYGATIRSNYTYNVEKTETGWKCTDNFVSTEKTISASVNSSVISGTVISWILGIAGTIITYFIISSTIF